MSSAGPIPVILIIQGPSLSLLGTRQPSIYGTTTLADVNAAAFAEGANLGIDVRTRQTNHEGAIIDELIAAAGDPAVVGVVLNAGAYAHTSLAIADAIRAVAPLRVVEVHLTNTMAREEARHAAPVGAACFARIEGFGPLGYLLAVRALAAVFAPAKGG